MNTDCILEKSPPVIYLLQLAPMIPYHLMIISFSPFCERRKLLFLCKVYKAAKRV